MLARPRVFVTREILPEALELISREADVEVWPQDDPPTPGELRQRAASSDGILTNIMDRVDAPLLDAAHRLKIVSQLGVGSTFQVTLPSAAKMA